MLPSFFLSYFITDPILGATPKQFQQNLTKILQTHKIDLISFRDKISTNLHHKEEYAKITLQLSKEFDIKKILINQDIELGLKLGFDGIHLTSSQFNQISYAKQQFSFVSISTHTPHEIELAKKSKANLVTYSPIFYKQNKGKPKGIQQLKQMVQQYQYDDFYIIGLGGIITQQHIEQIKQTNAKGFASIRYFIF